MFLITIATAMAITLTMLASTLAVPRQTSDQAAATRSVIQRFYAAANVVLATGNTAAFDGIVDVDARIGSTPAQESAGLTALANRLKQNGMQHPRLQLTVSHLVVDRDRAVADIELSGMDEGLFSATLEGERPVWRDWFRLRDGKVSGVDGAVVSFEHSMSLISAGIQLTSDEISIGVARIDLEPGASIPAIVGSGPISIRIETGELEFRIDGAVRVHEGVFDPTARGTHLFTEGQQLTFNAGSSFGIVNESKKPSRVFLVSVFLGRAPVFPSYPNGEHVPWQSLLTSGQVGVEMFPRSWLGDASITLLGRQPLDMQRGNARIVIDQLQLTPGTERLGGPSITTSDAEIVCVLKGTVLMTPPLAQEEQPGASMLLTELETAQVVNGGMRLRQIGAVSAEVLVIRLDAIETAADPAIQPRP
jgi:hypothetical protein